MIRIAIVVESYKILTVTYKQVSPEQLKDFMIPGDKAQPAFRETLLHLKTKFGLDELMYLSTCNRVAYIFSHRAELGKNFPRNFFAAMCDRTGLMHKEGAYTWYEGNTAVRHLYELAAGLDSMVPGEREIIRQIRQAYEDSHAMGLTGDDIRLAIKHVIPAAKKIFTHTRIAEKPVSVVSLAAQEIIRRQVPKDARILVIGAGETATNLVKYLLKAGYANFAICNRTVSRARKLAATCGGYAFDLNDLGSYEGGFDVMALCISSYEPLMTEALYQKLAKKESALKFLLDLSVPRNIVAGIPDKHPVHFTGIGELQAIAEKHLRMREAEREKAMEIIDGCVREFQGLYLMRRIERAHARVPELIRDITQKAREEVFSKDLQKLDPETLALIEKMLDYIEKKYIALTISSAKEAFRYKF